MGGSIGGCYGGSALYTNSYKLPMKTRTNELSKPTSINELVVDIEKHPDRYQVFDECMKRNLNDNDLLEMIG